LRLATLILLIVCAVHAQRNYSVAHYDVRISPDLAAKRVTGEETIRFRNSAGPIELDAGALEIRSVTEGGHAVAFERRGGLLVVPGRHRALTVRYTAPPAKGLVFFPDQVYTSFFTSDWMVCDNRPQDRSTLVLQVEAPGLTVQSSGRLDMPTPSFLYAFAAGRFSEVKTNRLRVLGAGPEIFDPTEAAMRFLESKSGRAFPQAAYPQVFTAGTVEQEAAYFTLLPRSYADGVARDPTDLWLLAHELAHQWYGIGIPCYDWSDFWLAEGMATFLADVFLGERFGAQRYQTEIEHSHQIYESLQKQGKDRALSFHGWSTPQQAGGSLPYHKGAWVLALLRREVGEDRFWRGLQIYTARNWGRQVKSADFQKAMESAAGRGLGEFFGKWVY
jgi:aminopeptidase N